MQKALLIASTILIVASLVDYAYAGYVRGDVRSDGAYRRAQKSAVVGDTDPSRGVIGSYYYRNLPSSQDYSQYQREYFNPYSSGYDRLNYGNLYSNSSQTVKGVKS